MKHLARLALLAVAAFVCGTGNGSAAGQPIEIKAILSLTGQAAFIGTTYQKTLAALEASVNKNGGIKGQPIHFSMQDDQSSPQVAVQFVNGLLAEKATAFLGPNLAGTCRAVLPLLNDSAVSYCLSPGIHPSKGAYMFSVGVDSHDQAAVIVRYFRERGIHDLGMIVSTDASGQDADAAFAEALKEPENGAMRFVGYEHFNVADTSVAAQLVKIQATHPQAIVAWSTGTPMGTTLRGIQETGITVPVLMNNANALAVQMKTFASVLPPQLYSYGPGYMLDSSSLAGANDAQKFYYGSLKTAGIESDYIAGLVWDPAMILVNAIRTVGANGDPTKIRDYIDRQRGYRGIAGSFDFTDGSQRGLSQKDMMVMRWDAPKGAWQPASRLGGALLR